MSYYEKYMKYKGKYLEAKGGERHECKPTNPYAKICIPSLDGKYKSKESCINDCENKYINHNLIKAHIKGESMGFFLFIKDIIANENIDVYVKGGTIIGLAVLKLIYNKYKNNDIKFKSCFKKFLELDLIKDWDFASYTKNNKIIDDAYRKKLDNIAWGYKLVPRAKTFILYQTRKPILIDNTALFEISVLDSDAYSKLELPMTTMKVKVHEYNLKYIFMFAKSFLTHKTIDEEIDLDIIKKMIEKTNIIIHPHKNGLYDPGNNFDRGELNDDLVKFIDDFANRDKKITQFLVTHMQDPFRLLYRLPEKNIPKTIKIKDFIKHELQETHMPSWLMDTESVINMSKKFVEELGLKLYDIYTKSFNSNKSVKDAMDHVIGFMLGIKFNRIQIDYEMLHDNSKHLLKLIFKPLVNKIKLEEIEKLDNKDKFVFFIKFLIKKELFST